MDEKKKEVEIEEVENKEETTNCELADENVECVSGGHQLSIKEKMNLGKA